MSSQIDLLIDEKPFEWIFASTRRFFRRVDFCFGANQRPQKTRRILFSIEKKKSGEKYKDSPLFLLRFEELTMLSL